MEMMKVAHNAGDQIRIILSNGTDKLNGFDEIYVNERINGEIFITFGVNYRRQILQVIEGFDGANLSITISKPIGVELE